MTSQVPIDTLIRLESGLRAELGVLRATADRDILEDAQDEYDFNLADAQLEALRKARQVLEEELTLSTRRLKRRTQAVRDANASQVANADAEDEAKSEEDLRTELYALRRRALAFAKEQWPVTQDSEQFEGGDFWDACIAACAAKGSAIEYSSQETGFAELLLQTGVADRLDDVGGMKRIKLADDLYHYEDE